MKQFKYKKMAALALVVVMAVSGVIEPKASTGNRVFLYGLHATDLPDHGLHCSWMTRVGKLYQKYDSAVSVTKRHHSGAQKLYENMQKANYMMILTHGGVNHISAYSSKGTTNSLTINEVLNGSRLNQLKVCLLTSCNSYKMADAINDMGARTAIGFTKLLYPSSGNEMQTYFNKYYLSGERVVDAVFHAYKASLKHLGADKGAESFIIYGDANQKF